ncbi:Gfo/Idh/MocA family protein [Leifsonia sp. YAF41]|uniref:Gfo/Idh/MocA family protein n=1 Tax=Leifsonia sp. YAF41 TaxID=3233086 RepID=UPI003F98BAC4
MSGAGVSGAGSHSIALIGQGKMAQAHAAAWSALGLGEQIAYVCTPRPGAPLADAPNARFVTDLDAVLADPAVDILSVCTPTPTHADIAIRALRAGKSVLLEKPIALTHAEAVRVAEVAEESPGTFMVAQVVRFFEGYRMLRESVTDGRLGEVLAVHASRLSTPRQGDTWMTDESASGGVLVDFAIHDFDQLNLYLGTPVAVTAVRGEEPGFIETTVTYADGGMGTVTTCNAMPVGYSFTSALTLTGAVGSEYYEYSAASPDSPYAAQAAYFLQCVESGASPTLCPTESAILALDVSLAARESLTAGRTVELP